MATSPFSALEAPVFRGRKTSAHPRSRALLMQLVAGGLTESGVMRNVLALEPSTVVKMFRTRDVGNAKTGDRHRARYGALSHRSLDPFLWLHDPANRVAAWGCKLASTSGGQVTLLALFAAWTSNATFHLEGTFKAGDDIFHRFQPGHENHDVGFDFDGHGFVVGSQSCEVALVLCEDILVLDFSALLLREGDAPGGALIAIKSHPRGSRCVRWEGICDDDMRQRQNNCHKKHRREFL